MCQKADVQSTIYLDLIAIKSREFPVLLDFLSRRPVGSHTEVIFWQKKLLSYDEGLAIIQKRFAVFIE